MNIGAAARRSDLAAKTIRYYEEIDLIRPARAENGYRDYSEKDVQRLQFLQRARNLGFSIEECRSLLSLYEDEERTSSSVKAMTLEKICEVDEKIRSLQHLKRTLHELAEDCPGSEDPDCPIINELSN
ncbi:MULTISPECIES: Cu(I)-responsive transcriptional regulator [Pseudovibrio]|uniref:Cu(I)-responsive transcriptional regulator n=1 Tax=Stappiaceae TaxID=2821832 RepID=UPI00236604F7|nr:MULTISPECIES: Cu(I)-responsive transcriptional regulator [Pseudovibrio]MDD7910875.1 Cu(I)-responsive transcriptional regulator [Pseudovibrio exalbescens]MDX5593416.1 Cu(I)-responsive transcriptional regulator [Pseudovibrio sp. SPO723]